MRIIFKVLPRQHYEVCTPQIYPESKILTYDKILCFFKILNKMFWMFMHKMFEKEPLFKNILSIHLKHIIKTLQPYL